MHAESALHFFHGVKTGHIDIQIISEVQNIVQVCLGVQYHVLGDGLQTAPPGHFIDPSGTVDVGIIHLRIKCFLPRLRLHIPERYRHLSFVLVKCAQMRAHVQ